MSGWIKTHRKLTDWQWITSGNHLKLFLQILLRANYKESTWRKKTIFPGQILTGRKQLAAWSGLSEQQVRTCLSDLFATGEITIKTTNNFSIITVCNWETYQGDDAVTTNTSTNQITNDQPTDNQQITTSKKANKGKKGKKNTPLKVLSDKESMAVEILNHLNEVCSRNFRLSDENFKLVTSLFKQDYTVEHIQSVIDFKNSEWSENPDMKKYLQPSTLFGKKFDQYLNQALASKAPTRPQIDPLEALCRKHGIEPERMSS